MNYISFRSVFLTVCLIFSCAFALANPINNAAQEELAKLETSVDGRLGVFAINTANNADIQYRAEERFPICSTSKVLGVAAILKLSMNHPQLLGQKVTYTQADLEASGYAPETKMHLTTGMTVYELSEAAITQSDNAAINLLMRKLGGPHAVTAFARSIGDHTFRLDRWEPELNTSIPGDLRDTSTPMAMAKDLQLLTLGNILARPQREQLITWLKNNTTGNNRIRASVPRGWDVGDKTGTSSAYGTIGDVAVIWPPKCRPIIIAIYLTHQNKAAVQQDDIIAKASKIVLDAFAQNDQCIKSSM